MDLNGDHLGKNRTIKSLRHRDRKRFSRVPRKNTSTRVCKVCGEEFQGHSKRKVCSRRCAALLRWSSTPEV